MDVYCDPYSKCTLDIPHQLNPDLATMLYAILRFVLFDGQIKPQTTGEVELETD